MCGIAGIISACERNDIEEKLLPMMEAINHRGPDDKGHVVIGNKIGFGHVRLSILDVSIKGHQPMYSRDGRFCIVFNGEIYNYIELKNNLETKYGIDYWQSHTDTEVILEGYAREGRQFIEKLNGIFALAICDSCTKEVFIARDRMGVKPFYFCEQNGCVFFASELKALTKIGLSLTLNMKSIQDQLVFMYVPEPYTLFNEVEKLSVGEYRLYKDGICKEQGFLDNSFFHEVFKFTTEEAAKEKLDYLLNESVNRQLISDVPISLFLSGGLDSSLITALSLKNGANIKDAYTISISQKDLKNEGGSKDDLFYAKIIASKFGLDLKIIEAKIDMLDYLPKVVYHLDDALSDPAAINAYLICESARKEGVKVMLSGQGADEIFGGYRKYRAMKLYQRIPRPLANVVKPVFDLLPYDTTGIINSMIRRGRKFVDNAVKRVEDQQVGLGMWISPEAVKQLFVNDKLIYKIGQRHYEELNKYDYLDPIRQLMRLDEKIYLTSHNLMYTDKMSMMAGVEARVPFLDFKLVDFAHQLPVNMMVKSNEQKYLLKNVAENYLPDEVIYRSKAGFGSPIRSWFRHRNDLTEKYFSKDYISNQGLFYPDIVNTLYHQQIEGKSDNAYFLYALLSFQIWYDIFVDRNIKF